MGTDLKAIQQIYRRIKAASDGTSLSRAELEARQFVRNLSDKQIEELKDQGIDIYSDGEDFKNALLDSFKDEIADKEDESIFTKSMDDVSKMDLSQNNIYDMIAKAENKDKNNAQVDDLEDVAPEDSENADENAPVEEGEEGANEAEETQNNKEGEVDENLEFYKLINEMFNDPILYGIIDADGSGEISNEEMQNFFKNISSLDGDKDNFSLDDIANLVDYTNKAPLAVDKPEDADEDDAEAVRKARQKQSEEALAASNSAPASGGGGVSGATGGGGVGGYGGGGGGGGVSNNNSPAEKAVTLEELEAQKTEKEGELKEAQTEISEIHSGENSEVKAAQDAADEKQEEYEKALEEDEKVSDELKEKAAENLEAINTQQSAIDETKGKISECEAKISSQQSVVASDESQVAALEAAVASYSDTSSDDPEKQAELEAKKAEAEAALEQAKAQLESDKTILEEYEQEKTAQETALTEQEAKLEELNQQKAEIEAEILENCDEKTKKAMETFNEAKDKVETVKTEQLEKAQQKVTTTQGELDKINQQINEMKAKQTEKEYSASKFDFDFDEKFVGNQEADLEAFKKNFEENIDKYQAVEDATGMPKELVAAIHWRESTGNFNTYLHNGDPLGSPTVHVPAGISFDNWSDAAIDAVTRYGGGVDTVDPNDINTWYEYAEQYNGLGYRNKGQPSPYVWAGTSNYQSGKYVADGVYDPGTVDQQLGVAIMLKKLLS